MTSRHAQAAKEIRQALRKIGVKAQVRAKSYTGGDSVSISAEDINPSLTAQINEIAQRHQMGHFNGMEDIYEYSNTDGDVAQVKYVMAYTGFSLEMKQKALEFIKSKRTSGLGLGEMPNIYTEIENYEQLQYINKVLYGKCDCLSDLFWQSQNAAAAA